ncbi:MAG: type II toxin-antitoxin system death-on-curing family toxin [Gammaproteobacteria bacterium]|nr:MAG: type II toxin-antitoxin system death-on-curing family toxin [Gammaproteobacteria bacterium]
MKIHDDILNNSGGLAGISLHKSLEAALNRAENYSFYEDVNDLFEIASIYCIAIAQGHLFNDGNKRTAFSIMYNFLSINGYELEAESEVIIDIMLKVAEKKLTKKQLSKWIKENVLI